MQAGKQAVLAQELKAHYDADLKSYFDTISHEKLLACLRHRIADRNVLGLTAQELKAHFQMWLEANALSTLAPVVVESDEGGTGEKMRLLLLRQRTRNEAGTPQECAFNSCARWGDLTAVGELVSALVRCVVSWAGRSGALGGCQVGAVLAQEFESALPTTW